MSKKYYVIQRRFADDHGMPLFETSAKDDSKADHVEAIFMTLAHKVKQQNGPLMKKASESPEQGGDGDKRRVLYQNQSYHADSNSGGGCCT